MKNAHAHICLGEVVHKRVRPVEHRLNYRVFSLAIDLDQIDKVAGKLKLFSLNRFNLFSLNEKQHGHRDGSSLSQFAWSQVRKAGFADRVNRIVMLFYPRILGFAFNPLTVYYCLGEDDEPVMMIYEVRNTFGEDLTYVLPAGPDRDGTYTHQIDKSFYVSPFNAVEGHYDFHVRNTDEKMTVGVALKTDGKALLRTHFSATLQTLTDMRLLKAFFAYPLMTLKVVAGIHVEALKLWRKGLSLQTRPAPPKSRITFGGGLKPTAVSRGDHTSRLVTQK